MVRAFGKLIAPYARRIHQMVGRSIVRMVDDAGALQVVQVTSMDGSPDTIERVQQYGLSGNPPAGSESVRVSICGSGDHSVIIAVDHRRFRFKGLASGEVALYDDLGQVVYLTREGVKVISSKSVTVDSPQINLGGERAGLLALVDERILTLINAHTHELAGVPTTPPTVPILQPAVCTVLVKGK